VAGEQNLSGNLFGGQGGDSITGKATSAIRSVDTAATHLVAQLKMASQLLTQMQTTSKAIAANLSKIGGGTVTGPNLSSTGGAGGASSAAAAASAASQSTASRMQSLAVRGTSNVGAAVGAAAAYGPAAMMSQTGGMFGADMRAFANTDATLRMTAPGRFTSTGAATKWYTSGLAAGQSANDAITGGAILANAGFTGAGVTGSNMDIYRQRAAVMQNFTPGADIQATTSGLAQFQSAGFVNYMRARGVNARSMMTGAAGDPQAIADQILQTTSKTGAGFYKMSQQQRLDQVNGALMSGGALNLAVTRSGLGAEGQQQLVQMMRMSAMAGRPVSSMSQAETEKFLKDPAVSSQFQKADAKNAQATAQIQSQTLDAIQQGYATAKDLQTSMLKELGKHTTSLDIIAKTVGFNTGLGPSGSHAAGNVLSTVAEVMGGGLGAKGLASLGKSAVNKLRSGGSNVASRAAGPVTRAGALGSKIGRLAEAVATPMMVVDAFANWSQYYDKYSDPNHKPGVWTGIKDTLQHPIPVAVGDGMRFLKGMWNDVTGGGGVGTPVGTRGAPGGGGGTTSAGAGNSSGLIGEALKWLGTPYSWGGGDSNGPSRGIGRGSKTIGFDCSGFVRYVFGKFGVTLPRTSQAMASSGQEVTKANARKGDLLVITWTEPNGHVGIYLGGDKMIHSPHTGDVVKIAPVPWGNVSHIRRVIGGGAVGDASVGSSTSTDIGSGPLPFGLKHLWEGQGFFQTPTSNALSPTTASGSGTGSVTMASGGSNGQTVFNTLVGMGFTKAAAAGVVGNLQQESGVNPLSHQNGGGPGRGIMQWTSNQRWAQMVKWAKGNKQDPNALGTQVSWMVKEMRDAGVYSKLAGMTDVHAATQYFENSMEKAGTPNMAARYGYADSAYKSFSEGSWRVTKDQLAKVHDGEMIIPSNVAETLRTSIREGFAGQGSGGSSGGVQVIINASFAAGTTHQQATELAQTFRTIVQKTSSASKVRRR